MTTDKLNRIGSRILWSVPIYALAWAVIFAVSFLINTAVDDATTAAIHHYVLYAGYPLFGIGWVIWWIIKLFFMLIVGAVAGIVYLLKLTFPYCLYFIGIPLVLFVIYKTFSYLANRPGPTREEQEAEIRYQERMRVVRDKMDLERLRDMANKK